MSKFVICALYKFTRLINYQALQKPLMQTLLKNNVKGTLVLAEEGINGTIAGTRESIDLVLAWLKRDPHLADLNHKESHNDEIPFIRTKVKLKQEIVTMGQPDIDPNKVVGTYVKPGEWNKLISDPDVLLIDTRNNYEVNVGTFKNAINPQTLSFRQFPEFVRNNLNPAVHKKIAMFCTGGIRCEKSTAYLKEQGFDEVYHLQGGILKYLEDVDEKDSLWQGECFVFDSRVTVNQALKKGHYDQCHACRMPITEEDKKSKKYIKGVSCPHCYDRLTNDQRSRFAEREKQVELARQRGERHIGSEIISIIEKRRREKKRKKELQRI